MGLVERLSGLALQQVISGAASAIGLGGAEAGATAVTGFLTRHFSDQSGRLIQAVQRANEQAWQALEVALAGDSVWERTKGLLARGEEKAFREQMKGFLQTASLPGLPADRPGFRQQCLVELRAARKGGALGGSVAAGELAQEAGSFARFGDPQSVLDAEWHSIAQMADELRHRGYPALGQLLSLRPGQGLPLLVVAVRYFFRRAVEEDEQLHRGLAWASWENLAQAQTQGSAGLADALTRHAGQIEQVLAETHGVVLETHSAVQEIQQIVREAFRGPGEKKTLAGFESKRCETQRLSLRAGVRNICLVAGREARLGKNRENDVVLRVLPSSPDNDVRAARISREHALLQFTAQGATWRNLGCQNGTIVAGQNLVAGQHCLLQQGTLLSPAGVLPLICGLYVHDPLAGGESYQR